MFIAADAKDIHHFNSWGTQWIFPGDVWPWATVPAQLRGPDIAERSLLHSAPFGKQRASPAC